MNLILLGICLIPYFAAWLVLRALPMPAMGATRTNAGMTIHRDLAYAPNGRARRTLDLYLPKSAPGKLPALILMVHDGAFRFDDRDSENVVNLLQEGYAIASVPYSLNRDSSISAITEECEVVVRWLRDNASRYGYDPMRVEIYGESADDDTFDFFGESLTPAKGK